MASKNLPAVPRRRYADFCNKICQKPTSCSATGRGQSQDEIGLAVASWSCERRGVSYAGILWSAPLASERVERRLTAILAADVAGYSRLTGKDEEGTHTRLREHLRVLIDPKISEHRGRIVKNTGDGMLVEFGSVVECLRCAIEIQRGMNERNIKEPQENRIELRIGINVGDVILDGGDIFGDGVNVAARLEGIAEPGGICISDDTHRQVRDKIDIAFEDAGEQQFKNIARPVRVHRVRLDTA